MPYNVTIGDISPIFTFKGQWTEFFGSGSDPYIDRYWGSSFHSSFTAGSQVSVTFNGTAIYIFGAKRVNHGHYTVKIDNGQAQRFDGYAPAQPDGIDGVFRVALFAQTGLPNGLHTVVMTNDGGTDTGRPYLDIDYVTWTSNDPEPATSYNIDDGDFIYTSPSNNWVTARPYIETYFNKTLHATNVGGATASITFEGPAFYLWGGTSSDHGTFSVKVDDHEAVGLNGTTKYFHNGQHYADGLGSGKHTITVTNTQSGAYLDVDFIKIMQSPVSVSEVPPPNPSGKPLTPVLAGTICGVVVGLAWIIVVVSWFLKRRKRKNGVAEAVDLLDAEVKPYLLPPGYGPTSDGPGWVDITADSTATGQSTCTNPAQSNSKSGTATHKQSEHPPNSAGESHGSGPSGGGEMHISEVAHTPLSAQRQLPSSLNQVSEPYAHTNERASLSNNKERPAVAPSTSTRGLMTDNELRESRMTVPERPQDWGPVVETESEPVGLPPDYNQVISTLCLFGDR
ncbi:transmembrane protein [Ceratobasidium sp. AG-Ba]|nr:transmembrane protein [Ceratobasidium sp. AG-Ba]QRW11472.1 transmembrane protein [Ceratobasidium sp. AG-Ba]